MPSNYTPATATLPDGAAVSTLVNGDAPSRDNLYVEAAPGATKKLTLALLADWCTSLWTTPLSTAAKALAYTWSGIHTFTNGIVYSGANFYVAGRTPVTIADATATIKLDGSEDHVITPTATRTLRLSNTDAGGNAMVAGERKRIRINCSAADQIVNIGREGTANFIYSPINGVGAAPYVTEVEVWFDGSVWRGSMHDSTFATADTEWP